MKKIQKKRPSIPCFGKDTCMGIEAVENIFQKKSKKSEPFGAFLERYLFGAILAKLQASRKKNRKKSEKKVPLTAFVERYLFGWIGNKFRCWEGNNWENGKKSKKVRKNQTISKFFWKILGEGKGVSTMATTIFCKKVQKNSPNGTIFGKILVRRRPGFLLDRKKN